jgi:hypothetical protein
MAAGVVGEVQRDRLLAGVDRASLSNRGVILEPAHPSGVRRFRQHCRRDVTARAEQPLDGIAATVSVDLVVALSRPVGGTQTNRVACPPGAMGREGV